MLLARIGQAWGGCKGDKLDESKRTCWSMFRVLSVFLVPVLLPAAEVSFPKHIAPLLAEQCVECHREGKAKGGYRLDTVEQMLRAGDSNAAPVVPGKPEESELLRLIVTSEEDDRMPKKADALPEPQIALLRAWIASGAKLDGADPKAALTSLVPAKSAALSPATYPQPLAVTALALSPDGATLACSGYREVTLWDVETGKLKARLQHLPERVLGLAWPAPEKLAVAGGVPGRSGEVWLLNPTRPGERHRLVAARDCLLSLATSPDGKLLAAGGADNLLRCFELPSGKLRWQSEPHADWITAVAFAPDGRHMATASRDRTARRIDSGGGEVQATFTGHESAVLSVAFSSDGQDCLSGDVEGQLRRWTSGGEAKKDGASRPAGRTEITVAAFFEDNTPLIATGSGIVAAVDPKSRQMKDILKHPADRVNVLLLRKAGDKLQVISGGHDGRVRIYKRGRAEPLREFIASPGW